MLFSYKAVRADGSRYEATLEASDRFVLYKELHSRGETALSVHEKGEKKRSNGFLSLSLGGTKMADRIMFAKNLSAMLKAGLPLARALLVLERQMSSKQWKEIFASLQEDLAKGVALSVALAKFPKTFVPIFISMVAAGQESGSLSEALSIVGIQLERSYQLQKKVRGAMMYPGIILTVMVLIGIMMFVYVLPKLTSTFKEFNVALPFATRLIIGASDFFSANMVVILLGLAALIAATIVFVKTAGGKSLIDRAILHIPVIGLIAKEVNSARTTRTLSSLLSSGVDIVAAIRITSDVVQNVHYKRMLARTVEDIQKGSTLQSLFLPRTDIYPSFVGEMIGVGEETGTLSKVLLEVALFYEGEVEQKTKDMSTIIEPVLMVVIGLGVGFFALAMISPIYSLSSTI
ncbi:MAG: type II secretion system F family protein [Candidatus Paceibacterota bacterium]|jgi:type IV pilus assembly protein PilC